jgi:hypothetical protein
LHSEQNIEVGKKFVIYKKNQQKNFNFDLSENEIKKILKEVVEKKHL